MVLFGNFFIARKGSFGLEYKDENYCRENKKVRIPTQQGKLYARQTRLWYTRDSSPCTFLWMKVYIPGCQILAWSTLGLLGLFYWNWSLGQKCFDNIKVFVYFIIKVGMVASTRSFMQTLSLKLYLAHIHYSYELMHVHVLECIIVKFFKPYIKGFFIKRKWMIPQVLIFLVRERPSDDILHFAK
jgi:hypothetical protein